MVENIFTQTHEEAVALGQLLLNHGALCHVYDQSAPFSNDHHLYRFLVTCVVHVMCDALAHSLQDAEAYATNKSGLLGLRHEPASPSELRWCCLRKRDFYWFEKPHSTRHLGHVFLQDILLSVRPSWFRSLLLLLKHLFLFGLDRISRVAIYWLSPPVPI